MNKSQKERWRNGMRKCEREKGPLKILHGAPEGLIRPCISG